MNKELGALFPEWMKGFYEDLVCFLPKRLNWYYTALETTGLRKLFTFAEELLLPGDLMHIVCRKYYIQQLVDEALREGIEQVVILGAGFDHLGAYTSGKGLPTFEIDTPSMALYKAQFLDKHGYMNDHLYCCSVNVNTTSIEEYLLNHPRFDTSNHTLIIAEGFFDYLNLEQTRKLLKQLSRLCPNHTLITTLFSLNELNFFHRLSFTSGVALVGEAIKLPLDRDGFIDLLSEYSYNEDRIISHQQMDAQYIQKTSIDLSVLKGFYIIQMSHLSPN